MPDRTDGSIPALKLVSDEDNPFAKMDAEAFESAKILCSGLQSFARQLAPLLGGNCLIVTPEGQVKVAALTLLELQDQTKPARPNA